MKRGEECGDSYTCTHTAVLPPQAKHRFIRYHCGEASTAFDAHASESMRRPFFARRGFPLGRYPE
ncbi:hypothetical protein EYF80_046728 [Liparis tanakae]|uniref:Uncharacterized protein n=1 Tax=Liparis tanakae TaxID=230148 RepID=A0A4Z2FQW2_9TELE|nr:hypothetical protein EYF80_046728 [Liparis tanakae]